MKPCAEETIILHNKIPPVSLLWKLTTQRICRKTPFFKATPPGRAVLWAMLKLYLRHFPVGDANSTSRRREAVGAGDELPAMSHCPLGVFFIRFCVQSLTLLLSMLISERFVFLTDMPYQGHFLGRNTLLLVVHRVNQFLESTHQVLL